MDRAKLKQDAKKSLQGKWGEAIKLLLVYAIICGLASGLVAGCAAAFSLTEETINSITSIVDGVVTCFFVFGISSFYLKLSRNEEVTYKELFSKTNLFATALVLVILVAVFVTLWSLLLIIPGIIASISYSQAEFIILDNPEMSAMEAIKKSKEIMNGHKLEYFILDLSFFGWVFLACLTFGIGFLWLIPYMGVTYANFYNSIKD